jgi:cytidine deaminase
MKKIDINVQVQFFQMEELSADEQRLVQLAIKATENSYAPYSHFCVGAGIRLENGMEIMGANQENAAFPSGLCAERTAIFGAQAQYPDQHIEAIAIAAKNADGLMAKPVSPCGSCRQVMLEIEDRYKKPMKVYLYGTEGVYVIQSVKDLLPLCFVDADMH